MKKALISGLLLTTILAIPVMISATPINPGTAPTLDTIRVLNNVVNWLFYILLIIAALFLIIAAFQFITASGDPDKVKTARNFVLFAIIGVLVAFAARGLVMFAENVART